MNTPHIHTLHTHTPYIHITHMHTLHTHMHAHIPQATYTYVNT